LTKIAQVAQSVARFNTTDASLRS